jgi:hypothetical protein
MYVRTVYADAWLDERLPRAWTVQRVLFPFRICFLREYDRSCSKNRSRPNTTQKQTTAFIESDSNYSDQFSFIYGDHSPE